MSDPPPVGGGRVRSKLSSRALIAVEKRTVFSFLVGVTALVAVVTGVIAHVIDGQDFPSVGIGIWWSIVTLGTVGYGDVVPHTAWGRVLGGAVIVFGVTFISFLVAIVTSMLVDANRGEVEDTRAAQHEETQELLRSVVARLEAIEASLVSKPGSPR